MSFVQKRGTMWLLQRLKTGEVLTQDVANELRDYIGQLESSQDRSKHLLRTAALQFLGELDPQQAAHVAQQLGPPEYAPPERKSYGHLGEVHQDICLPMLLESDLLDLAYWNKTARNEMVIDILAFAVNNPGVFGLIGPSKTPS